MPSSRSILNEIGNLSLIISIPQLISAPLFVILLEVLNPIPDPFDIIEVLDFLVISFPLTLAVALITYFVKTDQDSFIFYVGAIIGAALLSNFLHHLVYSAFPSVDIDSAYRESFSRPDDLPGNRGAGYLVNFAMKLLSLYWEKFGVVMFLQSCAIGIYSGIRYFKTSDSLSP
jgi:hypothetical protein